MDAETIRLFIGGGAEHTLPTRVLEHSIRARTEREIQITPLLEVERDHPIPKRWRRKAPTSFSFQRFLIPGACGFQGRGIYLDSDQVVQGDVGALWDTPFPDDATVLTTGGWQTAVMLIDCAQASWDINDLCQGLDDGRYKYAKLSSLKYSDLATVAGAIDPLWNCQDRYPPGCKLLHYTGMKTQPWLRDGHECGLIWNNELLFAVSEKFITKDDVMAAIEAGHVRPSLALLIKEDQPYPDSQFVFPDDVRRRKMKKRKVGV